MKLPELPLPSAEMSANIKEEKRHRIMFLVMSLQMIKLVLVLLNVYFFLICLIK